jgi:hypothetical protein
MSKSSYYYKQDGTYCGEKKSKGKRRDGIGLEMRVFWEKV